ncbi:hypothetical protein [Chryseobacterium sp. ON_d1]|uniref:hypothetical protein n=1 Tax=Chryseobacterium sp. ON_d1 TaxID=2583211 RepID=UPI0011595C10|nr:hypothetical protein [Chryseobacterium sp. ON_d1]
MKTLRLIIAGIALALTVYSCSNDRDEEARNEAIEKVKASNQKFKLNQSGMQAREGEPEAAKDTIIIRSSNSLGLDPNPDPNPIPEDGGDPKDVPVPPRR